MHPVLNLPAIAKSVRRRKVAYVVGSIVIALLLCPALIWGGRYLLPKLWGDLHFVNFAVVWIPAVLSVFVAFVPDRELETRLRIGWRISVILCGVLYSVMLWHQQTLADESSNQAQQKLLSQAISEANKHADEQFGKVHGEVQDVNNGLNQTKTDLVNVVRDTSAALGVTIGSVTKPQPPQVPALVFTLWGPNLHSGDRIMQRFITATADGSYPVDFMVYNNSETTAKAAEIWVNVCDGCSFASEPTGFERTAGSDEHVRHKTLGNINPGVGSERISVLVKAPPSSPGFVIAFRYSCETCGKQGLDAQIATLSHTTYGPPQPDKRAWKLQPMVP